MGKRLLALVVCIVAAFMCVGCNSSDDKSANNQETKIIRVAFNQNEEHPQYKAMRQLLFTLMVYLANRVQWPNL